jgi:hypothetical protein
VKEIEDLGAEAEESLLLETVAKEQLMTQQTAKYLAFAMVICKVWRYRWHSNYL